MCMYVCMRMSVCVCHSSATLVVDDFSRPLHDVQMLYLLILRSDILVLVAGVPRVSASLRRGPEGALPQVQFQDNC